MTLQSRPLLHAGRICLASLFIASTLVGCGKKNEEQAAKAPVPAAQPAPAPAPAAAAEKKAEPADDTPEGRELAKKKAALEYATMEDSYLNDPKGQWAESAKASSSFGSANKEPPDSKSLRTPWHATGAPNGSQWGNNNQDMGFDWLELTFAKPVNATEVRVVFLDGEGSVSKVELIDTAGNANTVWSGIDDTKRDRRGPRTWFIRKFDKTPYKVQRVKITIANAVVRGYKEIDAVQLVGE